ncbi:MAG: response regulator [Planctomycetes bacterium]|nr:response regulator [Planctomycetota bacterium]
MTVVALFGLGLLFAAWILLHRFDGAIAWGHGIVVVAACIPWLPLRKSAFGRIDRLDRLGSLALVLGATLGFTRDRIPGDPATLLVVELGIEAVGAIAFAMVFYRRASLARLRLGIDGGELLKGACDSVGEPIVVVGAGCRVLEVNWFAEILFSTRLIGQLACETPYFTRDRCDGCPVGRCFDERKPVFFVHRDGERSQHEVAAFPVIHDGEFIGRQIQRVTDVAVRTQSERHLRFLAHVVDAVSDAVLGLDLRGVVTTANAEAERLLVADGISLVGQDALDALRLEPGVDRERIARLLERREAGRFEMTLTLPSHVGARDMVVSLYPVVDDVGAPAGAALLLRDETEARVAHDRLRQAERLSLLGRFVSSVAHELNNPLAVVYGRAEQFVTVARDESGAVHQAAQDVLDAAERCRRIVAGLLRYARKDGSSRQTVDLRDVAREALELVAQLELARRCGARIELQADADPVTVCGDAVLLAQVVTNLITNACHSIRRGGCGGTVRVAVARAAGDCTIEVADDGPGLDPAAAAHLFEAFHTTKREGEGTGIGLWLSFALVEDHGGSFEFQERRPHGALFRVRLPASAMPLPSCAIDPVHAERPSAAPSGELSLLVVDDEEGIRDLLEAQLTHAGHRVVTASGGREGLARAIGGDRFDAVVCDRMMPDLAGSELYRRAVDAVPALRGRFVFVTGDVLGEDANDVSRGDGNEVLAKPFRGADLMAAIERVAARARDVATT